MDINYIILAHKCPEQLKRLVLKLSSTGTKFYIHIDKNIDLKPFKDQLVNNNQICFLEEEKREQGAWGNIGLVKAALNAMEKIVQEARTGYCVLLSGQDYPLHDNNSIQTFLTNNYGTEYISIFPIPHKTWDQGGLPRLEKYKINKSLQRGHFLLLPTIFDKSFYQLDTLRKLNFLRKTRKFEDMAKVFQKRKFPKKLKPYGGGQWWALTIETVQEILGFISSEPNYLKYHKYTLIPDEIFFHSILKHLDKPISPSITYVNWSRPNCPLPVTFDESDFEELQNASKEKLFARKFDFHHGQKILKLIDQKLLQN